MIVQDCFPQSIQALSAGVHNRWRSPNQETSSRVPNTRGRRCSEIPATHLRLRFQPHPLSVNVQAGVICIGSVMSQNVFTIDSDTRCAKVYDWVFTTFWWIVSTASVNFWAHWHTMLSMVSGESGMSKTLPMISWIRSMLTAQIVFNATTNARSWYPYWILAFTSAGKAPCFESPFFGHTSVMVSCSVMYGLTTISRTCLLSWILALVFMHDSRLGQLAHPDGRCWMTLSGCGQSSSVLPICPFWPPAFLLDFFQRLFGEGLANGFELLWEFLLFCSFSSLMTSSRSWILAAMTETVILSSATSFISCFSSSVILWCSKRSTHIL